MTNPAFTFASFPAGAGPQGPPGGVVASAANAASVASIDPNGGFPNGTTIWVQTFRSYLKRDTLWPGAIDGVQAIAPAAGDTRGGAWVRQDIPDPFWQTQTAWFLNAATGNDENNGLTSGTAIKTPEELVRRLGLTHNGAVRVLPLGGGSDDMPRLGQILTILATYAPVHIGPGAWICNSAISIAGASEINVSTGATFSGGSTASVNTLSGLGPYALSQGGTRPAPANQYAYTIQPVESGRAPYVLRLFSNPNTDSTNDNILQYGYNADTSVSSQPQASFEIEATFLNGSNHQTEMYWQMDTSTGSTNLCRPFSAIQVVDGTPIGNVLTNTNIRNGGDGTKGAFSVVEVTASNQILLVQDNEIQEFNGARRLLPWSGTATGQQQIAAYYPFLNQLATTGTTIIGSIFCLAGTTSIEVRWAAKNHASPFNPADAGRVVAVFTSNGSNTISQIGSTTVIWSAANKVTVTFSISYPFAQISMQWTGTSPPALTDIESMVEVLHC